MTSETPPTRHEYLFDGRRVQVRDLLKAGLLQAGAELVFRQPRRGAAWRAHVRGDGWIELESGRAYASPSRAAAVAAGAAAYDGWRAWQMVSDDRFLADLRDDLIGGDMVATDAAKGDTDALHAADDRHRWLREVQQRARDADPVHVSVRELLTHWNADSRSEEASESIEADLANRGLVTHPNFRQVTPDVVVAIRSRSVATETGGDDSNAQAADDLSEEIVESEPMELVRGLAVGTLPSARAGVTSVKSTDSLETAVTKMLLSDFSQVAVIDGRTLKGAVSWRSLGRARNASASATLSDAMVAAAEVRFDLELVRLLPQIQTEEFVFVRDEENKLSGIVTAFDVVAAYGDLATPFLVVGEVDRALRYALMTRFEWDDVRSFLDPTGSRGLASFDQLTIGDYQRYVENPDHWTALGWALDRATFVERLDEVRKLRNDLMHFNPDPVALSQVQSLRHFAHLLQEYC